MKRASLTSLVFILMNFVVAMSGMVLGGILDQVALSLGVPVEQAGLLNTMFSYGAALGVPVLLILLRGLRRGLMLKAMLALSLLFTLLLVLAHSFEHLLLIRLLMGIVVNSYGAVAMSMAVAMAAPERQGRALALYISGSSLALLVGLPLTRLLSSVLDWRSVFWILWGIMLLSLGYFHLALPKEVQRPARLRLNQELFYLRDRRTSLVLVYTLIMFTGSGALYIFITPYLLTLFPALEPWMSLILLGLGLSSLLGNAIGGQVSDRIGYAKSMLLGGGLQLLCVALLLFSQASAALSVGFALLWLMSVWFTGLQVNAGIVRETNNKSSFMLSLNGSAVQLGYALGSSIAALIIASTGIQHVPLITLVTSLAICGLQWYALNKLPPKAEVSDAPHH